LELATALALGPPDVAGGAREFLTAAVALSEGDVRVYMYFGNAVGTQGRYPGAESAYREALEIDPNLVVARVNLGFVLAAQHRLKAARAELVAGGGQAPEGAGAQYNLGVILQGLGETAGAVEAYQRAVAADPPFAEAWNNLGNALTTARRFDEAV